MSGLGKMLPVNPLYRVLAIAGGVLSLLAAVALLLRSCDKKDQRIENKLEQKGAVTERLRNNEEVINAVQNAQRPVTRNELERVRDKYDRTRQNGQ